MSWFRVCRDVVMLATEKFVFEISGSGFRV